MVSDDEGNVRVQSEDDDAGNSVESGDDEGPEIGHGAWVGGVWHDPIDPHPFPPRESRSRSEFDHDYEPNLRQVMTTRLIKT
jgi:hypothetical protein